MKSDKKNIRIEGINFLRIFSMLLVLMYHAIIYCGNIITNKYIYHFIRIGAIGTIVFITISGFGLRCGYGDLDIKDKKQMKIYFKKRFLSIYPIYMFFVILAFIMNYNVGHSIKEILFYLPVQLTMLPILFFPALSQYGFNNNLWFLSTLFVLYLIFPYINQLVNTMSKRKKIICCFILPIISFYAYYLNIEYQNAFLFYYVSPIFRLFEFTSGIMIADVIKEYKCSKYFKTLYIIPITILLIIGVNLLFPHFDKNHNLYSIIVIPFTLLCITCISSGKIINKIGSSKVIKYLTSLCLCLYLCQSITVWFLHTEYYGYVLKKVNIAPFYIYMIFTFLCAVVVNAAVERPLNKLFKSRVKKAS